MGDGELFVRRAPARDHFGRGVSPRRLFADGDGAGGVGFSPRQDMGSLRLSFTRGWGSSERDAIFKTVIYPSPPVDLSTAIVETAMKCRASD